MSKHIAVIGAGGWGTALANLLGKKGYDVRLWAYLPEERDELQRFGENKRFLPDIKLSENLEFSCDMEWCIKNAECIVSAVPSGAVEATAYNIAKYIDVNTQPVVTVSKGLHKDTKERLSTVIERCIPEVKVAALSGPSHAEEVAREMITTNVAASSDEKIAEYVCNLFTTDYFRVYTNSDITGVEMGGALKNIIALCAGILDGMGMGDNAKAALMTRGMAEISRLGVKLGANRETFFGLSGMGDLIVTCTSMHSRNRRAGILIGQGKTAQEAIDEVKMVVEGVPAAIAAYKLAKNCGVEMPITSAVYSVICEGKDARECVTSLMTRPKKSEVE
ncbi:MAG: NAD(P)H-dependent glycerol-3-phosphate dehydrogenase [Clostridia bacterium]|nr:NAD(P)H-dependent glycerol-3-phosphate dehydrogenase [Clostridia bacterium]